MRPRIMQLANLLADDGARPIFFLGAGVTIESGGKTTKDIIDEVVQNAYGGLAETEEERRRRFNAFLSGFGDRADRRAIFHNKFSNLDPSLGYLKLAHLVKDKRLKIVLTTNFDPLMEQALTQVGCVPNKHYLIHIRQAIENYGINLDALRDSTMVHLVKLHGDSCHGVFLWTEEETNQFPDDLQEALVKELADSHLVVIGCSGRDRDVMAVMNRASPERIWWVGPDSPEDSNVTDLLSRKNFKQFCISNERSNEGEFDNLMDALHRGVRKNQQSKFETLAPDFMVLDERSNSLRGTARPERFYKGERPWFHHIASDLDIRREVSTDLFSLAERNLLQNGQGNEIRVIAISGPVGSGKRTCLLRLGWTLYRDYSLVVAKLHWRKRRSGSSLSNQITALQRRAGQPVCILIEQLPQRFRELTSLFNALGSAPLEKPVLIVGTGTEPEWKFVAAQKFLTGRVVLHPQFIRLETLHSNDIRRLKTRLQILRNRHPVGQLSTLIPTHMDLVRILNNAQEKPLLQILWEVINGGMMFSQVFQARWDELSHDHGRAGNVLKAIAVLGQYGVFLPFSLAKAIAGVPAGEFSAMVFDPCKDVVVRHTTDWADVIFKMRHEWLAAAVVQVIAPRTGEQTEILKELLRKVDKTNPYERKTAIYLCVAMTLAKMMSLREEKNGRHQHGLELVRWLLDSSDNPFHASCSLRERDELDDWLFVFREFEQWEAAFRCYETLIGLDPRDADRPYRCAHDLIMLGRCEMSLLEIAIRALASAGRRGRQNAKKRLIQLFVLLSKGGHSDVIPSLTKAVLDVWPDLPGGPSWQIG